MAEKLSTWLDQGSLVPRNLLRVQISSMNNHPDKDSQDNDRFYNFFH